MTGAVPTEVVKEQEAFGLPVGGTPPPSLRQVALRDTQLPELLSPQDATGSSRVSPEPDVQGCRQ